MNAENLIIDIRNQIVRGVIDASQNGALCRVPKHFKLERQTPIGTLSYQVPITLTRSEDEELSKAFSEHLPTFPAGGMFEIGHLVDLPDAEQS